MALKRRQRSTLTCNQNFLRLMDQQQVDAFASQPADMRKALSVDQCDVGLTVLGEDPFGAGFDLLNDLRESGTNLREGH